MDHEETDTGSGERVNGVDRLLVSAGVAAMALVPTFMTLIAKPAKLAPLLKPSGGLKNRPPFLGPGLFFVGSLLFSLLIASFMITEVETPSPEKIEAAQKIGVAYSIGVAIGTILNGLEDRLSSGDFWSAIAIAMPVFGFAIVLAVGLRAILGWTTPKWTAAHATGAALYMVGGLMTGTALIVVFTILASPILGTITAATVATLCFFMIFCLTGVQAYGFGQAIGAEEGARLGFASILIPFYVIALLVAAAFLSSNLGIGVYVT